ncbi:conserved hypothetical protein [Chthoniobacter flavus Ellin428]|uniref:Uncharacterized protein n=1 Tax=Chthoniobacter flavus Ellin428 TaxID=497964 RepID=B4CZ75_9BACT|nr:hypothetical protein [Chthoniobacter flavus]EDY20766.1 conserved hypothetical protein [Chthoniobacter flavus Ellin428]TCO89660.1 hypothetical protein EV701_11396 [Chthoniobacter flavus]
MPRFKSLFVATSLVTALHAQDLPATLPQLQFHLTARPWQPLRISRDQYLDAIEGICRFTVQHQDAHGAVIDPFLHREHQYSTPYFAFAVGTLIHAGRAADLLDNGVRAMDRATECFAKGDAKIPDAHGEFFLACLPGALELYRDHVPAEKIVLWRDRLKTPREQLVHGGLNNWRTYGMKGEWLRAKMGLVEHDSAVAFIEDSWLHGQQRDRIVGDKWNLYQDHTTNPEPHAVEAVGRGNLLALVESGYDGPSSGEIRQAVERGTATTLLLQDPSGQCPPNGRTDDHVFNDVLYQLAFDVMAERAHAAGDDLLAGEYRHAAMLSFQSIARWRRQDAPWAGSYYVTKNHFDPAERVGYQPASNYGNYNGAVMMHLAESWLSRKTEIPEQPAPTEIGGYAAAMDGKFASVVANAGGMQIFADVRSDTYKVYDKYWSALGVVRFARAGWDSRLGPSDGERESKTGRGITFAPTWTEDGHWVRMADVPDRYRGKFSVQFAHPLLVRCAIDYAPFKGSGPSFRQDFVLTPDGVLVTTHAKGTTDFGVTWPLLENDGAPLRTKIGDHSATTSYGDGADEEAFLAISTGAVTPENDEHLRSTYGWLLPVRALATDGLNQTFVYPRSPSDPAAEKVRASLRVTDDGFQSSLGAVHGTLYIGRTSAGGEGNAIDLDGDGKPDVTFDTTCQFVLQLRDKKVVAVEADRKTTAHINGRSIALEPYHPTSTQ